MTQTSSRCGVTSEAWSGLRSLLLGWEANRGAFASVAQVTLKAPRPADWASLVPETISYLSAPSEFLRLGDLGAPRLKAPGGAAIEAPWAHVTNDPS